MSIFGNPVGSYTHLGKTFTLIDESGAEYTGVVVENEQKFTATDNDVRKDIVYASNEGASVGTKVIPAYHTTEGAKLITVGSDFKFVLSDYDAYDYTKLQVIICAYNSSLTDSVSAEKISINDSVYNVGSTNVLSSVTKDSTNKAIDLGISNTGSNSYVIRYFTYKEID